MNWYQMTKDGVLREVDSKEEGLSGQRREEHLAKEGPNALTQGQKANPVLRFLSYFHDLLIYVLLVAFVLKIMKQEYVEGVIILIVVLINAVIGYAQERKTSRSINSLSAMMSKSATIVSGGEKKIVDADSLVLGDIVVMGPGKVVPADLRILEAYNLVIDEAMLTGESIPVVKSEAVIAGEVDLGDQENMAFTGTMVNSGSGIGVVVAKGNDTQIGEINTNLREMKETVTPLIKKMKVLNKQIFYLLSGLVVFLIFFTVFKFDLGFGPLSSSVIALIVASVPEGLPTIMSIIMSVGVSKMVKENAVIKELPAVETLGSMTVICSDKTGTLTKNEMSVVSVVTREMTIATTGSESMECGRSIPREDFSFRKLIEIAMYCNETLVTYHQGIREVIGNPTEGALIDLGNRINLVEESHGVSKIPFDSAYKYMAVLEEIDGERHIFFKGAPDVIMDMVDYEWQDGETRPLDRAYWEEAISDHAKKGQRVLAAAYKKVPNDKETLCHDDLRDGTILVGLYGIIDPPKKEAIEAVRQCREAGISVKMITGDHQDTAMAIAEQIGLEFHHNSLVGSQIEKMSDAELEAVVMQNDVFARTTPEHKLRLVTAIQNNQHVVGMTGDGVNDAPALKKADIGIAMGIKGTEVTKEAADMILSDDNFATIAAAVREGRRVYTNLKKTIYFALPTCLAQGLLVVISLLMGIDLPMTTTQILWLNMVTTITLSFALGFEPAERNVMKAKPRPIGENIMDGYAIFRVMYVSLLIAGSCFLLESFLMEQGQAAAVIQTTLVQALVLAQAVYMINCREFYHFSIGRSMLQNKSLWISLGLLIVFQSALLYFPPLQSVLSTTFISLRNLGYTFLSGLVIFVLVELEKRISLLVRKKHEIGRAGR